MEGVFDTPGGTMDHHLSPNDNPFSDNHQDASDFLPYTDPFSDDHATTSTALLPHDTPTADTSHTSLPSPPSNEDMDSNSSSHHSEDSPAHGPVPSHSPPLIDVDLGFEDSGLDPTFSGHPSLSEQLKERFLAGYHGGGKQYCVKYICTCLPLIGDSKALV
jgi:hypothetical protein